MPKNKGAPPRNPPPPLRSLAALSSTCRPCTLGARAAGTSFRAFLDVHPTPTNVVCGNLETKKYARELSLPRLGWGRVSGWGVGKEDWERVPL
jgi:hypothetical protein